MIVEDRYTDILQNIEYAIVDTYRRERDLTDYDVARALEVLTDTYSGEKIGRPPRSFRLSDRELAVVNRMREMCEWRLGRAEPPAEARALDPHLGEMVPISVDEIILCLKRITKSVGTWTKEGGMRGYLSFIVQFVG